MILDIISFWNTKYYIGFSFFMYDNDSEDADINQRALFGITYDKTDKIISFDFFWRIFEKQLSKATA